MLPTAYPYDFGTLTALWEEFVQNGVLHPLVDPAIARSWLRCQNAGLNPYAVPRAVYCEMEELEQQRQECFDLIAITRPLIEDVYQFSGESNMVVYLTNRHLVVLECVGDRCLREMLYGYGFQTGFQMAEEFIGTNAAALALNERMPVQVVGPEHFFKSLHHLTGTAAPVHTPWGEVAGVIGIITLDKNSHPHTLGIVMAAARAVENQLRADFSLAQAHRHLAELKASLQALQGGIIFLDAEGIVTHINARAGEILGISPGVAPGRPLLSLTEVPAEIQACFSEGASMPEREVFFRKDGASRPVVASVSVIREGTRPMGFVMTLKPAEEVRQLARQMMGMQASVTFDDILGWGARMRQLIHYGRAIARCDAPVLLLGEPGTGKSLFAQAIHNASHYAGGPFVYVDCATTPRELIAFELFGYEDGFGPNPGSRPGKFEIASGGTLYLHNVENLPLNIQMALLNVMDTKQITRIGGVSSIPVKVRVIAASSTNLYEEMRQKRFCASLYYRLRSLTLTIPPLRERAEDIPLLVTHIVSKCAARSGKEVTVSPRAMAALKVYPWPGNIRELENVLEWAVNLLEGTELDIHHLPETVRQGVWSGDKVRLLSLEEMERQAIVLAGQAFRGNVTQMANALGIGRTTLWRKMRALGISPTEFRRTTRRRS